MIKRPICAGAAVFTVLILLGSLRGGTGSVPPGLSAMSGETCEIRGRVASREETAGGTRLFIEHFSYTCQSSSENNSENDSENNSENTSGNNYGNTSGRNIGEREAQEQPAEETKTEKKWRLLVYLQEDGMPGCPEPGDQVRLCGTCMLPEQASNPGQFDSAEYYRTRKTALVMNEGELLQSRKGRPNLRAALARLRDRLTDSMAAVFGEEEATLISAITLGDRSGLNGEIRRLYQEGGIAHILAVSSLHLTIVCMGVYRVLRKTGSLWFSGLLSGLFALLFCQMTGGSVSAVRATVMFLLWLGSQAAGRTCDAATSIAIAALLILPENPLYLRDSGFLLSFGCVGTLNFVLPAAKRLLPVKSRAADALLASCVLSIGTLPVVMRSFYQVTPYAPLLNLAVVPCMSLVMVSGLAGGVAGLLYPPVGALLGAPCHYLLKLFELLCRLERKLPGAVLITGCPALWKAAVYVCVLAGICVWAWRKKPEKRRYKTAWMIPLLAATLLLGERRTPELRITVLDVGQGDGILVESGKFACLIDGGSSSEGKVWQYRIGSALKYYGIRKLDAVFLSHGDWDHISGIQEFLEGYEENFLGSNVGDVTACRLIFPDTGYADEKLDALRAAASGYAIPTGRLKAGGEVRAGDLKLRCLSPSPEWSVGDGNADSMVLLLEFGEFSALFTGDLEKDGEADFLRRYADRLGQITLLKVGHHGSKNGTSEALLNAFSPRICVISCGKKNRYGHPAEELLERLKKSGAALFRTDRDGAVTVCIRNAHGSQEVTVCTGRR